jgi:RNA polymerase sigma-70 factor (ECF subfamily)
MAPHLLHAVASGTVHGNETDEDLMTAYQGGDVRAFERLLARHEKPVWNFLRRFSRDATAAEDLLQEVFLRVVKNGGEWKRSAKFSTWVYAIARNLCIDQSRRAVHRKAASLDGPLRSDADAGEATLHDRLAAPQPGADAQAGDRQAAVRIDAALAALPDDQREVFLMREAMDMSFAEIAAVVGASEPTVKSRMRYALEKLRHALGAFYETGAPSAEGGAQPSKAT